jgi:hypothetical protein
MPPRPHRPLSLFVLLLAALCVPALAATTAQAVTQRAFVVTDEIGESGSGAGQFANPIGIDADEGSGDIYIADAGNQRVQKLDADGDFILMFGRGVNETTGGNVCTAASGDTCKAGEAFSGTGSGDSLSVTPNGNFSSPEGIAVDQSDGSVYVLDRENLRVQKFTPNGNFVLMFGGGVNETTGGDVCTAASGDTCAPATPGTGQAQFGTVGLPQNKDLLDIDSTGKVYVGAGDTGKIKRFSPSGAFDSQVQVTIPFVNQGVTIVEPVQTFALDSDDNIWVVAGFGGNFLKKGVAKIDPAGNPLSSAEPGGTPQALAVDGADNLFLASGPPLGIFGIRAYDSANQLFSNFASGALSFTGGVSVNPLNDGIYVTGSDKVSVFDDPPLVAPTVEARAATNATSTSANLHASINPSLWDTRFHFEYGTDTSYAAGSIPSGPGSGIGAGGTAVEVRVPVEGLAPNTTYHFRAIAESSAGTTAGPDRTFRTFGTTGPSLDRRYEMVSPVDKNGGDIAIDPYRARSSPDGDAVTFMSTSPFADAGGTGIGIDYIARRGADGWTTHSLTPNQPPSNDPLPSIVFQAYYVKLSEDLSKGIIMAPSPLTDAPNVKSIAKLYLRDNVLSGGPTPSAGAHYSLLNNAQSPIEVDDRAFTHTTAAERSVDVVDATPDLSRVLFESRYNLTPQTTGEAGSKLYEWHAGNLTLAGILPDDECGSPPCAASFSYGGIGALPEAAGMHNCQISTQYTPNMISDDGSRVFFSAAPFTCRGDVTLTRIFMRVNQTNTVQLNASERTDCAGDPTCGGDSEPDPAPDPSGPQGAALWTASADGTRVFFTTDEQLVDEDDDGGSDLYMYETGAPSGEKLTLLSVGPGSVGDSVVGASGDGHYVYFTDSHSEFGGQIYVWHDGIVRIVGSVSRFSKPQLTLGFSFLADRTLGARVSKDGRHFLFITDENGEALTGYDNRGPGGGRVQELYVYDYESDSLVCGSCPSTGSPPEFVPTDSQMTDGANISLFPGASLSSGRSLASLYSTTQYLTRALDDDGSRVFFSTPEALVPADTNGFFDVYEYDTATGEQHLISSGQCACHSFFYDASPDGSSVFFITSEQLVRIDRDELADLYVARAGGGIDAQNAPPPATCQGDACQPPPVALNDPTPSSASFSGAANQPSDRVKARHCPKGRKSVKASGKVRCVKKRQSSRKRGNK